MELQKAICRVFSQLTESLNRLETVQYTTPCFHLSGNTIGQHVRHIIEMFICLGNGYDTGEVDYEKRKRDYKIEADKLFAIKLLEDIQDQISKENKPLLLLNYYHEKQDLPDRIGTNYYRELSYNLEHTIHHMALIRVGLRELGNIPVGDSYGVAASTLKYRQQCAQ